MPLRIPLADTLLALPPWLQKHLRFANSYLLLSTTSIKHTNGRVCIKGTLDVKVQARCFHMRVATACTLYVWVPTAPFSAGSGGCTRKGQALMHGRRGRVGANCPCHLQNASRLS